MSRSDEPGALELPQAARLEAVEVAECIVDILARDVRWQAQTCCQETETFLSSSPIRIFNFDICAALRKLAPDAWFSDDTKTKNRF